MSDVKVFTRQATGLTKEIGTVDTFVYNVNNQNIGGAGGYVLHHAAMIKQAL
mgnify:CR=1 FL=1